jgi:hypothetical protein
VLAVPIPLPWSRFMMPIRFCHRLVLILGLALACGCASSSSEPTASGRGIGGIHRVSVGDELVLRFPVSKQTGAAKWRLTSFDSMMLRVTQRPRLEGSQVVIRFAARTPGETDVIVTRTATGPDGSGSVGERRRFRVRISS